MPDMADKTEKDKISKEAADTSKRYQWLTEEATYSPPDNSKDTQ